MGKWAQFWDDVTEWFMNNVFMPMMFLMLLVLGVVVAGVFFNACDTSGPGASMQKPAVVTSVTHDPGGPVVVGKAIIVRPPSWTVHVLAESPVEGEPSIPGTLAFSSDPKIKENDTVWVIVKMTQYTKRLFVVSLAVAP